MAAALPGVDLVRIYIECDSVVVDVTVGLVETFPVSDVTLVFDNDLALL